jgi:hypothetical protein
MSASDTGYTQAWELVATGVKKFKDLILGNMATQEASAVAITGGSVVGATLAGKVQTITAAGAISLDSNHVKLTGPASGTYAITLAAPSRGGQLLVIEMVSTTSTNAVTLALTNVVGQSSGTGATFNAAAETLTLVSMSTKWVVLDELGVTMA